LLIIGHFPLKRDVGRGEIRLATGRIGH
jgi:hypothetical protein